MARRRTTPAVLHCGMCEEAFPTRQQLKDHIQSHAANTITHNCPLCKWPFPDSRALEDHQLVSQHGVEEHVCPTCKRSFATARSLGDHTAACSSPSLLTCSNCSAAFSDEQEHKSHIQFPKACHDAFRNTLPKVECIGYVDHDAPAPAVQGPLVYTAHTDTASVAGSTSEMPSNLSDGKEWCSRCNKAFISKASLEGHQFHCHMFSSPPTTDGAVQEPYPHSTAVVDQQLPRLHTQSLAASKYASAPDHLSTQHNTFQTQGPVLTATTNVSARPVHQTLPQETRLQPAPTSTDASAAATVPPAAFSCNVQGCTKSFRSELGLKQHKTDVHGIGGKGLDLTGKDSWMLNQRNREDLRMSGQLQPPTPRGPASTRGRGRGRGGPPAGRPVLHPAPTLHTRQPVFRGPPSTSRLPPPTAYAPPRQAPVQIQTPPQALAPVHLGPNTVGQGLMSGPLEFEQADKLKGKILRLLISADIFIRHDGKMTACGINWTRIEVGRQLEVPAMFDKLCSLPRFLQQGNYVPSPKTFADEYKGMNYDTTELQEFLPRDRAKPGLDIVALACAKVVLADGLKEVVKIAAIDVASGRVLMSYLVCTDTTAQVADWRSRETGLYDWADMEQALTEGYKVLKGWTAARLALSKFVDSETIIVGHNLRADLDALRIMHGRAIDIASLAEKAAKGGPLSKSQLKLDNLCRDFCGVHLTTDPQYGRDALMDAFACREVALWIVKHKEEFEKIMHKKSADYQKVM